jgi:hypothetical protein
MGSVEGRISGFLHKTQLRLATDLIQTNLSYENADRHHKQLEG